MIKVARPLSIIQAKGIQSHRCSIVTTALGDDLGAISSKVNFQNSTFTKSVKR